MPFDQEKASNQSGEWEKLATSLAFLQQELNLENPLPRPKWNKSEICASKIQNFSAHETFWYMKVQKRVQNTFERLDPQITT